MSINEYNSKKILSLKIKPCQTISRFYYDRSFEKLIIQNISYLMEYSFENYLYSISQYHQTIDDKNVESIVFGKRY